MITRFVTWWFARKERQRMAAPIGCCQCGTGGPCYRSDAPRVTRYLYDGSVMANDGRGYVGWSACSAHRLDWATPVIDYGKDIVVTSAEAEAAFAAETCGAR